MTSKNTAVTDASKQTLYMFYGLPGNFIAVTSRGNQMRRDPASPALRGGLLALLAAALFGPSMLLVQGFGAGIGPFTTAPQR